VACWSTKAAISLKRVKLLQKPYRNSPMLFQMAQRCSGHRGQRTSPPCGKLPSLLLHLRNERLYQYDSTSGHVTVTSQHSDLPFCHGTSVTPSGLFPSVCSNPTGSFVTGTPAAAKLRATKSLKAWCLAVLPRALLHYYSTPSLKKGQLGLCI